MHTREHFDTQLAGLQSQLGALGEQTLLAIEGACAALSSNDRAAAEALIAGDQAIDAAQRTVDHIAIQLIATQQPVARDLRRILATLGISAELERIADYAKGIARLVRGDGSTPLNAPEPLVLLGQSAHSLLAQTLQAVRDGDVSLIEALGAAEGEIDRRYREVRAGLLAHLAASGGSARAADLLFVAHHIERIADRATNIGERLVFRSSGTDIELNP